MKYWKHENEVEIYEPINHEFTYNKRMVSRADDITEVEFIIGRMEEGGEAEPHSHKNIEQIMHILQGKMHAKIGDDEAILTAGHTVIIPKKVVHEIRNAGKETLKFVLVYSPMKE